MSKFLAGQYTATYNGKALGQSAEGFRLSHQFFKRLVTGDLGAETPQDGVYRGREQFAAFRLIEAAEAGVEELAEPYGDPLELGQIGILDQQGSSASGGSGSGPATGKVKSLVLTAVAGTSAADGGPATMTFPNAILAEGFPVEVLYGPDLREIPVRMRIYPDMEAENFGTIA